LQSTTYAPPFQNKNSPFDESLLYCQVFWVYPIYTSSFILNSLWYQEIADEAFRLSEKKTSTGQVTYSEYDFSI